MFRCIVLKSNVIYRSWSKRRLCIFLTGLVERRSVDDATDGGGNAVEEREGRLGSEGASNELRDMGVRSTSSSSSKKMSLSLRATFRRFGGDDCGDMFGLKPGGVGKAEDSRRLRVCVTHSMVRSNRS